MMLIIESCKNSLNLPLNSQETSSINIGFEASPPQQFLAPSNHIFKQSTILNQCLFQIIGLQEWTMKPSNGKSQAIVLEKRGEINLPFDIYKLFFSESIMNLSPILTTFLLLVLAASQNVRLETASSSISVITNGQINSSFDPTPNTPSCGMPELFILPDSSHSNYRLVSESVQIYQVRSKWQSISSQGSCSPSGNCDIVLNNQCNMQSDRHEINWIEVDTSLGNLQYLVDCDPSSPYKPIEIGLLILIMIATLTLTLSAMHSKAWSYYGFGYKITARIVVLFNILLLAGLILGYLMPAVVSVAAQVVGSVVGAAGVGVCISELIWLTKNQSYRRKIYKKLRIIDVISHSVGLSFIPLYWLSNGQWVINDIMAICSIIALMKLLKIQSLSVGIFMLLSLLVIEATVGIFVHYVIKISYNNYIINLFQNPIIMVMPTITHELYRRCAWLPISAVLFPGLFLSYLRRFDRTRGTFLYFLIGLVSFYLGSMLWMIIDLQTVHSLPFAIISEPVTILIVCLQSFRRNQFMILWRGTFHDEQLSESFEDKPSKETQIVGPSAYAELTGNLRMSENTESSDSYRILT